MWFYLPSCVVVPLRFSSLVERKKKLRSLEGLVYDGAVQVQSMWKCGLSEDVASYFLSPKKYPLSQLVDWASHLLRSSHPSRTLKNFIKTWYLSTNIFEYSNRPLLPTSQTLTIASPVQIVLTQYSLSQMFYLPATTIGRINTPLHLYEPHTSSNHNHHPSCLYKLCVISSPHALFISVCLGINFFNHITNCILMSSSTNSI